jgi:chemotaxis protein histidine kinase CheA
MVDHELDELRREFLGEAEEKVTEIETLTGAPLTPEAIDRLAYLAHQLKGSGGSYGYGQISDDAAELEKAFEALIEGKAAVGGHIDEHVRNLRTEIEHRVQELSRR